MATLIKDVIRDRSRDVAQGRLYPEVTDRVTRRLLEVQLNLISNYGAAVAEFSKLDSDYDRPGHTYRDVLVGHGSDIIWEAGALISAVSEKARDKYGVAAQLAADVIRAL